MRAERGAIEHVRQAWWDMPAGAPGIGSHIARLCATLGRTLSDWVNVLRHAAPLGCGSWPGLRTVGQRRGVGQQIFLDVARDLGRGGHRLLTEIFPCRTDPQRAVVRDRLPRANNAVNGLKKPLHDLGIHQQRPWLPGLRIDAASTNRRQEWCAIRHRRAVLPDLDGEDQAHLAGRYQEVKN